MRADSGSGKERLDVISVGAIMVVYLQECRITFNIDGTRGFIAHKCSVACYILKCLPRLPHNSLGPETGKSSHKFCVIRLDRKWDFVNLSNLPKRVVKLTSTQASKEESTSGLHLMVHHGTKSRSVR